VATVATTSRRAAGRSGEDARKIRIFPRRAVGTRLAVTICFSMMFALWNLLAAVALVIVMLACQAYGRRLATARGVTAGGEKSSGGTAEAAVFTLLGLLLAFTFSGAASRFDDRRYLVVEETNAIGTAWLRIDLLPADRQADLRDLFRQYLDARIDTYRHVPDEAAVRADMARALALQDRIWQKAAEGADAAGTPQTYTVLLPALNQMIDITTTRTAVTMFHPPPVIYGMVVVFACIGSIFSGWAMAASTTLSWVHRFAFPVVTAITLYVIVDIEYPRLGLIKVDHVDQLFVTLRQSMR